MIDLYTWPTPNGHKIHIMLEETGLAYRVHPIDIGAGDQFKPELLAISPNNKIPAMVDQDRQGVNIDEYPNVKRWRERIAARPAVKRGVEVLAERRRQTPGFSKEQAEVLFGGTQYARR